MDWDWKWQTHFYSSLPVCWYLRASNESWWGRSLVSDTRELSFLFEVGLWNCSSVPQLFFPWSCLLAKVEERLRPTGVIISFFCSMREISSLTRWNEAYKRYRLNELFNTGCSRTTSLYGIIHFNRILMVSPLERDLDILRISNNAEINSFHFWVSAFRESISIDNIAFILLFFVSLFFFLQRFNRIR